MLVCVGDPIEDPVAENDVAFFVVRDPSNTPTKPFTVLPDDLPIVDGKVLYSAQNFCDPIKSYYSVGPVSQAVSDPRLIFCKLSMAATEHALPDDHGRRQQLKQDGWLEYLLLQMVSRPGFSGSPIWDDQLQFYGMDIRGSTPKDSFYKKTGDVAVCLPSSNLYAARQRVQDQVRRLTKA